MIIRKVRIINLKIFCAAMMNNSKDKFNLLKYWELNLINQQMILKR
jgi:hypothetical protein